jgi:hypothetical protein
MVENYRKEVERKKNKLMKLEKKRKEKNLLN